MCISAEQHSQQLSVKISYTAGSGTNCDSATRHHTIESRCLHYKVRFYRERVMCRIMITFKDSNYKITTLCSSRFFFFSSRRRHTRCSRDWSSDVCSSDLAPLSSPHRSRVLETLCADLNETHTKFPGTELEMHYAVATARESPKSGQVSCPPCQEF